MCRYQTKYQVRGTRQNQSWARNRYSSSNSNNQRSRFSLHNLVGILTLLQLVHMLSYRNNVGTSISSRYLLKRLTILARALVLSRLNISKLTQERPHSYRSIILGNVEQAKKMSQRKSRSNLQWKLKKMQKSEAIFHREIWMRSKTMKATRCFLNFSISIL